MDLTNSNRYTADKKITLHPADFSDSGSRDVFCNNYGDTIRWTPGAGWFSFNGIKWKADEGAVMERAVQYSEALLYEAKQQYIEAATILAKIQAESNAGYDAEKAAKDAKAAKAYLTFAQKQRNLYPLKSVVKLSESKMQISDSDFDADPNLVCCSNGVLDLRTMELLPHNPGYLISKSFNADFDPDADTSEVETFLKQIFQDDEEKKPFLKRILGYALSGEPKQDKFFSTARAAGTVKVHLHCQS